MTRLDQYFRPQIRWTCGVFILVSALAPGCTSRPDDPSPAEVVALIERDFERFCAATPGDVEGAARAAEAAGWREFLRNEKARFLLEPGPGGPATVGDASLFLYAPADGRVSCEIARPASDTKSIVDALANRLTSRLGVRMSAPVTPSDPCKIFDLNGVEYGACDNFYPDAPATASLRMTAQRPDH